MTNIKSLIEYLDEGIEGRLYLPSYIQKEKDFAEMLRKLFGEPVEVCKISIDGSNPLVVSMRSSLSREYIKEQIDMFIDNQEDFRVEYATMPKYELDALPEHQGW